MQQQQQQNQEETLQEETTSIGQSKGSKFMVMVGGAVAISVVFYFLFSEPTDPNAEVNNDALIISKGGEQVAGSQKLDFNPIVDSLENVPTMDNQNFNNFADTQNQVPDAPAVPELSEDLKQQIIQGIPSSPVADSNANKQTYTKEEVDTMIQDKIKEALEDQMQSYADNVQQPIRSQEVGGTTTSTTTTRPATPRRRRITQVNPTTGQTEVVEEDVPETEILANGDDNFDDIEAQIAGDVTVAQTQPSAQRPPAARKTTTNTGDAGAPTATDPNAISEFNEDGTLKSDEQLMAEQAKRQEDELNRLAKNRAMQERKTAPMFKMSGGAGPTTSVDPNENAIILTYTDNKIDIQNKAPDVTPQQVQDLSNVILEGKVISAVLETAIDTDTATSVRAVITKDIFAEEGKNILIPRGSRVIGNYSTSVAAGQTRVTINWNRIIRVDGMSLNIASIGADRLGRAGVPGELDNKYVQRLANSFLSSFLSVGTALATEKVSGSSGITTSLSSLTGDTTTTSGKASDYALVDATQSFMDEAQSIVDSIAQEKPVIRIPQGQRLTIMVTQDVTLPVFKRNL